MHFLLQHQVVPIYSVPRKPFSQASIEGNNSVFARKFWRAVILTASSQSISSCNGSTSPLSITHGYQKHEVGSRVNHFGREFIPEAGPRR